MKIPVGKCIKVLTASLLISPFFMSSQAFSVETWNSVVETRTGNVTTSGTTYTDVFSPAATVTVPSGGADVLVLASWSAETATGGPTLRIGTWRLSHGSTYSLELSRSLSGGNDEGVATLVHIFTGVSAGSQTFNLEHKSDSNSRNINTFEATIVAIPLTDSSANVTLSHDVQQHGATVSTTDPTNYTQVVATDNVTVSTASQNALFIAASFNSTTGSGGAETGQWKLQYGSCGTPGCTVSSWSDVGGAYMERKMSGTNDTGAVTLYGLVGVEESPDPGYYSTRLVMKSKGGSTVETLNATVSAVSLSYDYNSQIGYLPRFHTRKPSGTASSNSLQALTNTGTWTSSPITLAGTANIFIAGSSYGASGGAGNIQGGWGVGFTSYPPGPPGYLTTGEVVTRDIADTEDVGSTGVVGLAESFSAGTYTPMAFGRVTSSDFDYSSLNVVGFSLTSVGSTFPQADLSITKSSSPDPYVPGSAFAYTIVVSNNGPSDATGSRVQDTLPPELSGFAWTCTPNGSGASCGTASGTGDIDALVDLPSGTSATFSVNGTIPSGTTGALANTATVSPPSGTTDPVPGDNSDSDTNSTSVPIPTMTGWGIIIFVFLLGIGSFFCLIRQRRVEERSIL